MGNTPGLFFLGLSIVGVSTLSFLVMSKISHIFKRFVCLIFFSCLGDQEKDSLAFVNAAIKYAETLCQAGKESFMLSQSLNDNKDIQVKALRKPFTQQDQA